MLSKSINGNINNINNINNNIINNSKQNFNFIMSSDLNQEYEGDELSESIDNLSINNTNNSLNLKKNFNNNCKKIYHDSNIDLFSSKSTKYSSIINIQLSQDAEKIYNNIYENKYIKNSIIISNDEEINKELYLKIIDDFYIEKNNMRDRNINKICYLTIDSKKIDKLLNIFNENLGKRKKIMILQGGKGKKMKNDYNKFKEFIQNTDIFISIPDVFYKLLSIGFININQFSILFIDDCHLCEGNHPYNIIMQEFYYYYIYRSNYLRIKESISIPNIIGFTDSPFFDKKIISNDNKCKQLLMNLSTNLNSQMIISPNLLNNNNDNDNNIYIYKLVENNFTKEKIEKYNIIYKILSHYFIEKMLKSSFKYLIQNKNLSYDKKSIDQLGQNYLNYTKQKFFSRNYEEYLKIESNKINLSSLSRDSLLFNILEDMIKYLIIIAQYFDILSLINFFRKYSELYKTILNQNGDININNKMIIKEIEDLIAIIRDTKNALEHIVKNGFNIFNDRLTKFTSYLKNIYNLDKHFKTIIFVPSRKLAYTLNEYLKRNNLYKSDFIAGVNTKKEEILFLSLIPKITNNIINERNKKYNKGDIDILICTPSVCDILEIIKCDYIIIFNELSNSNSDYIRIKNLANNKKAKLIFFTYEENKSKNLFMKKVEDHDFKIIKFFENNQIARDFRSSNYIQEKISNFEKQKFYFISETQAKISVRNSLALFNEINNWFIQQNQKLIVNKYIEESNKDKLKKFKCTIELNGILGNKSINSDFCGDKQSSEAECYLILIIFLHKIGYIDDNLKIIDKFNK